MLKLKRLTIQGFRGILAPLRIDLTRDGQPVSTVVYGRNGTGKSSLTDAWEWLWSEKIAHLASEGAEQGAYPHAAAPNGETWVEAEFNGGVGTLRLVFDNARITRPSRTGDFAALHAAAPYPCHIRFADLGEFVFRTKAERYDRLAVLMGFAFQVELQKVLRRIQRDLEQQLVAKRQVVARADQELTEKIGGAATDDRRLWDLLAPRLRRQSIPVERRADWLQSGVTTLRERVARDPTTQRYANLRALGTAIKLVRCDLGPADATDRYCTALVPLRESEQTVKNLHLLGLYANGLKSIDPANPNRCPLCGNEFPGDLTGHIETEGKKLKALREALEKAEAARKDLQSEIVRPQPDADSIRAALEPLATEPFAQQVQELVRSFSFRHEGITALGILGAKAVQETTSDDSAAMGESAKTARDASANANELRKALLGQLADEYKGLEADPARAQLAADLETASYSADHWPQLVALRDALQNLEAVQEAFDRHVESYMASCAENVTGRFGEISNDVSTFFSVLEDRAEGLADPVVKVVADQERAVVLEIGFHGLVVNPAHKYLSESQLNSFGLAVFLASAKRFNPGIGLLILDDVVNSLDGYKRPRLITLLKQQFADYQILLLTHDDVWKDRITRELPSWKRMHFTRLEYGVGPIVANMLSVPEDVQRYIENDQPRIAGQLLGPLMEDELQDYCQSFGAQVTYNRKNEYTLEPLLTAFAQRLRDKLGPAHPLSVACGVLGVEAGFRNLCAHEKNPAIPLTTEEMTSVFAAWLAVVRLARCTEPRCGEPLSWNGTDFRCSCGRHVLTRG